MPDALLEPVGLGPTESALYLQVLSTPRCTTTQLADSVESTSARIRPCLRRLMDSGLITRLAGSPARYAASPPEVAVDALAARRQEQLERLRAHVRELATRFQGSTAGNASDLIELVEDRETVLHRVEQLQLAAQHEVMTVDCPPYVSDPNDNPIEEQQLARGVTFRGIYDGAALEAAGHMRAVLDWVAAGEQARSLPSIRMKMMIADRRQAVLPLSYEASRATATIFLGPSTLLTALISCFEMLWERATPIGTAERGPLDERDRELLSMLASGQKDTTIMSTLGITQRTMTRRVGRLCTALDARTRFQAGLQAAKRGWL